MVDWSLGGIMTSNLVIHESESTRPGSSVIIPYFTEWYGGRWGWHLELHTNWHLVMISRFDICWGVLWSLASRNRSPTTFRARPSSTLHGKSAFSTESNCTREPHTTSQRSHLCFNNERSVGRRRATYSWRKIRTLFIHAWHAHCKRHGATLNKHDALV